MITITLSDTGLGLPLTIDAGHVRTARGHQGRTFEVMAAQVSNDDGTPVLFSGVPREADQHRTQLNGVLTSLGMTADTEVTILSDGADGPRSLGEAASTGECARGWPNATVCGRRARARFTDAVKHIRWRLWHGQTRRALCLIQRTLTTVKAKMAGKTAAARSAAKLAKALTALETYISGLADLIIDYASARLDDEPFSTSPTEGAVQWLLHRRMGARQQLRQSQICTPNAEAASGSLRRFKLPLDTIQSGFDMVDPTIQFGQRDAYVASVRFGGCHPDLEIAHIGFETVKARVQAGELFPQVVHDGRGVVHRRLLWARGIADAPPRTSFHHTGSGGSRHRLAGSARERSCEQACAAEWNRKPA